MKLSSQLERDGYAFMRNAIGEAELDLLNDAIAAEQKEVRGGLRGILSIDAVRRFACSSLVRDLVTPVLGDGAAAVRGIFFDKTLDANWPLAWHRDLSIAVQRRVDVEGCGPWSDKDGVPHVTPPHSLLKQMLTLRVHLDPADETNGALKVRPGSHRSIDDEGDGEVTCTVERGDVVLMRPMLRHASDRSQRPSRRRVVHLEFAADLLPAPLQWAEWVGC